MRAFILSCLGLLAMGQAYADGQVTGQYQLHVPDDAARVARLSGKAAPTGRLTLHVTGRFTLEAGDNVRHGRYRVDDDHITLTLEDETVMGGIIRDGHIVIEGLDFDRGGNDLASVRRFPTDASSNRLYRIERAAPVEAPLPAPIIEAPRAVAPIVAPAVPAPVFVPAPAVPVAPVIRPARKLESKEVCGFWTVRRNGLEDKGMRMELREDGTFHFGMTGATSEGTWSCDGCNIVLVWTKIDGDVVDAGSVHKTIPVADDASAFQIDTYRYERATGK